MRLRAYAGALLTLVGCESADDPPTLPDSAPAETPPVVSASASPSPAAVERLPPCSVRDRVALATGGDGLKNVRVVADGDRAMVTWEDHSEPDVGDSSRSAQVGAIDWRKGGADRVAEVMLPYRAYASATYSYLGATRERGAPAFVAYGLAGAPVLGLHVTSVAAWSKVDPHMGDPLPPVRDLSVNTAIWQDDSFAVAADRPVAVMSGQEGPCPSYYACDEYAEAMEKGLDDAVRVVDLREPPASHLVWRGRLKKRAPFAPAIAFGTSRGAVAYRADGEMFVATLDGASKPELPVRIGSGDLGAPAVAFDGDRAIVVWAERPGPRDPFRIVLWDGKAKHPIRSGTTSAFAPSIAVDGTQLLLTWMEGDERTKGIVRLGRIPLAGLDRSIDPASVVTLSPEGGNARDPEISAPGGEVVVAWSAFAGSGPDRASHVEVRRLACGR